MVKIMIYYRGKESKKIHTLVMKKYLISLSDFYDILTILLFIYDLNKKNSKQNSICLYDTKLYISKVIQILKFYKHKHLFVYYKDIC